MSESFMHTKDFVISPPDLGMLTANDKFQLESDSSTLAAGITLFQLKHGCFSFCFLYMTQGQDSQ